ncbi:MAG: HepT-like ribonuclease domain-containing protein [Patescibacteria group bacterium]
MNTRKKNPGVYLQDILTAIERIGEHTAEGKQFFINDGKTQDAVIRQLSVIGEASAKLPAALKAAHSSIPWKKVIGMRNIIVHDYSETDIPTIWNTVERDLPILRRTVEEMLQETRT